MDAIIATLLGAPLVILPVAALVLTIRRAPTVAAAVFSVAVWGAGGMIADPDSSAIFDLYANPATYLETRPLWRGLLGGTCQLGGVCATLYLIVRSARRRRLRGHVEQTYFPDAPQPESRPKVDECPKCGAVVRTDQRECPWCLRKFWREGNEEEDG